MTFSNCVRDKYFNAEMAVAELFKLSLLYRSVFLTFYRLKDLVCKTEVGLIFVIYLDKESFPNIVNDTRSCGLKCVLSVTDEELSVV